jgi:ribosomal-protein-alanine N-acetyltransferase
MTTSPVSPRFIKTNRLTLRPTRIWDADRAFEIREDWEVTRMLRMTCYPPDRSEVRRWFADHQREWRAGEAYRFTVELAQRMIGIVDVDEIAEGAGSLGYWLERRAWGRGYAVEGAQAVTRFAFEVVGLSRLEAGHAEDNATSARVLTKLGFVPVDTVRCFSRARREEITHCRYVLTSARLP